MTSAQKWAYKTAQARAVVDNGIARLSVSGIVTPSVSAQILADNAIWLARAGAAGQVADYSGAAMCLTVDNWLRGAHGAMQINAALQTPTAILLAADVLSTATQYSMLMAQSGVWRAPFLDRALALEWAAQRAAAPGQAGTPACRRSCPASQAEDCRTCARSAALER